MILLELSMACILYNQNNICSDAELINNYIYNGKIYIHAAWISQKIRYKQCAFIMHFE